MRRLARNNATRKTEKLDLSRVRVEADIFNIFLLFQVAEKGRSPRRKGGAFYLEIEKGEGASEEERRGGAHGAWADVCGQRGGVSPNIFLWGRNSHQALIRMTKPKNRTNSTKEFSEQFEGLPGHCPVKQA